MVVNSLYTEFEKSPILSHCIMKDNMRTYLEPVDSTAVDERREHTQSVSESITNRRHGQNYMQILFHSINEVVVHGQRCGIHFLTLDYILDIHLI